MSGARAKSDPPCSRERVVDLYFIEHRGKALDIAAFLDRVARAKPQSTLAEDFRLTALRRAIEILADDRDSKARRILELWSDKSEEPLERAGEKGAAGAPYPRKHGRTPG